MECQSKSCHKYLLLQVWCGLLTVTMVVMAAFLTSSKSKSTEDVLKKENPTTSPTDIPLMNPLQSKGPSHSYIQLMKSLKNDSWEETNKCEQCSLVLLNNSIHCMEDGVYFIYAQVTFTKYSKVPKKVLNKKVSLNREERPGKSRRKLVEGTFPTTEGSVWVAKIVKLQKQDSVSLVITEDFLKDHTFWGAYQLH